MAVTSVSKSNFTDLNRKKNLSNLLLSTSSISKLAGYINMSNVNRVIDFLVVAGGGAGGANGTGDRFSGGGGGAGGYRTSVGTSGGGASAEPGVTLSINDSFTVTVGAGGAGSTNNRGLGGVDSNFGSIVSEGGGRGGGNLVTGGGQGGSAGGARGYLNTVTPREGTAGQGYNAGSAYGEDLSGSSTIRNAGSGGGAGAPGGDAGNNFGGDGGDGVSSSITGTPVTRAGGGGGGSTSGTAGSGGSGGGGDGVSGQASGNPGLDNTGGGGGGSAQNPPGTSQIGGNGGSGIVVIRYPATRTLEIGAGLTSTTSVVGPYKVTQFTAGTDTITVR